MVRKPASDRVTLRLKVGKEVVDFATFEIDPGVTAEKQELTSQLWARASVPAKHVLADADGCRLVWDDGWPFVFTPPAWREWWGNKPPVQGLDACVAFEEFSQYLYGDDVVGGNSDRAIKRGETTLWAVLRDFPEAILHSASIQRLLYEQHVSGGRVTPGRGARSREYREYTLDRWMTTVSRVEEFVRLGGSLAEAFERVAKAEAQVRRGRDTVAQVRGEYERGRRWQRLFRRD